MTLSARIVARVAGMESPRFIFPANHEPNPNTD